MRLKALFVISLLVCLTCACDFNVSYEKDLSTGLIAIGSGLSCDDIYLSDGVNKINRTTFSYGERFVLNLNDIKGFEKIGGNVFPGMELLISDENGDTTMFNKDLYENDSAGYELSPLLLEAFLRTATPLHSGNSYTFRSKVWDKKGEGTFTTEFDFDVETNSEIDIIDNGITYEEIYLFSDKRNTTITDGVINLNENIYLLFEGLNGFKESDGKVQIGISIKVTDKNGKVLLEQKDLSGGQEYDSNVIKQQVAPHIIVTEVAYKGPVIFDVRIWDKNGDNDIMTTTVLDIEE